MTETLRLPHVAMFAFVCVCVIVLLFDLLDSVLAVLSLMYVVPFMAAAAVTVLYSYRGARSRVLHRVDVLNSPLVMAFCVALFSLTETFSVYLRVVSSERTLAYFGVEGVAILVLSLQLFLIRVEGVPRKAILLTQIGTMVALEISLKTMFVPYFTGSTDIILHERYVRGITESGFIGPYMDNYQYVPVFHVISSALYSVLGLGAGQDAILLLSSALGFALPFIFYSVLRRLGVSGRHAMLYSFVAPLSYVVLSDASAGVASFLSFVLLLLCIHVSLSMSRMRIQMMIIALILAFVIVLNHQVSIPVFAIVLFFAVVLWGRGRGLTRVNIRRSLTPVIVLVIVYAAYQSYSLLAFYSKILMGLEFTNDVWIPREVEMEFAENYVRNFVLVNIPFALLLFFAFLGWLSYATRGRLSSSTGKTALSLTLFGAVAIATYIPGLMSVVRIAEEYLTVGGRTSIVAEQLVLWFGVLAVFRTDSKSSLRGRILLACVVAIMLAGSVMSQSNTLDSSAMEVLNPRSSTFFQESELVAFSFVGDYAYSQLVLTDFVSSRYIDCNGGNASNPHIQYGYGVLFPSGSTVLFRTTEFATSPLNFYTGENDVLVPIIVSIPPTDLSSVVTLSSVVYSSGSVDVLILESDLALGI